jgi:hypothetical protein
MGSGDSRGPVWTMHQFLAKRSLLLAIWRSDGGENLKTAIQKLFSSNGWIDNEFITSLSHWVCIEDEGLQDRRMWARLFASAHQLQLARDRLRGDDRDKEVAVLKAMAADPVGEILRLEREALEAHAPALNALMAGDPATDARLIEEVKDKPALKALPDVAAYRCWLDYAASTMNLECLRPHCNE